MTPKTYDVRCPGCGAVVFENVLGIGDENGRVCPGCEDYIELRFNDAGHPVVTWSSGRH